MTPNSPSDAGLRIEKSDLAFVLAFLIVGAIQIATVSRLENYFEDSSFYMGLAHNLRTTGHYDFNFELHTKFPPGFPILLASIAILTGHESFDTFIRFMPVLSTLGFIAWFFVLRREAGRTIAGAACLLVATSAPLYELVTQRVYSDAALFLASGVALLCFMRLEKPDLSRFEKAALVAGFCFFTAASVLLRSAGIALCAAFVAWAGIAMKQSRAWRVAGFVGLAGLLSFAAWIGWTKYAERYGYEGHGISYANQFVAKDPHQPELGKASALELISRLAANAPVQASHLVAILTRIGYVIPVWYSPLNVIALALLLCGLADCALDRGKTLLGLYFLAYFGLYVLWPFDEGPRFMLPVAPLALVLMCWGGSLAWRLLCTRRSATLSVVAAAGAIFTIAVSLTSHLPGLQAQASVAFWPILTVSAAGLLMMKTRSQPAVAVSSIIPLAVAGILVAVGLSQQAVVARANLAPDAAHFSSHRAAEAASWLKAQGKGIAMAEEPEIIHRLTGQRIESFPVTSDARIVVEEMRRENVRYLVVYDQVKFGDYYRPTQEERWNRIDRAYPQLFQLAYRGAGFRIFERVR